MELIIKLDEDQMSFLIKHASKLEGKISYQKGEITRLNKRCDQIEKIYQRNSDSVPVRVLKSKAQEKM